MARTVRKISTDVYEQTSALAIVVHVTHARRAISANIVRMARAASYNLATRPRPVVHPSRTMRVAVRVGAFPVFAERHEAYNTAHIVETDKLRQVSAAICGRRGIDKSTPWVCFRRKRLSPRAVHRGAIKRPSKGAVGLGLGRHPEIIDGASTWRTESVDICLQD